MLCRRLQWVSAEANAKSRTQCQSTKRPPRWRRGTRAGHVSKRVHVRRLSADEPNLSLLHWPAPQNPVWGDLAHVSSDFRLPGRVGHCLEQCHCRNHDERLFEKVSNWCFLLGLQSKMIFLNPNINLLRLGLILYLWFLSYTFCLLIHRKHTFYQNTNYFMFFSWTKIIGSTCL